MTRKGRNKTVPQSPQTPASGAGETSPAAPRYRWFWFMPLGLGILVVSCLAVWWWTSRGQVEPTLPADISDSNVRVALEEARHQVELHPRSATAWGELALTLQANGFTMEASRYFAEAQRLDPGNGSWPYFRALGALGEDPEKALPFLRQAARGRFSQEELESAVRLRLAESLLEREEFLEAKELFEKEWQKHPGDPRTALGLGLIAKARGQREAANYLTMARDNPVASKTATAQLAALARDQGKMEVAARLEKEFAAMPNETPSWPDPFLLQLRQRRVGTSAAAQVPAQLEAQHRYAEAAKAYSHLIERQPTAQNYIGAGLNAVLSGQTDRGLDLIQKGINIDPKRPDSHFALAQAYFQLASVERERKLDSKKAKDQFLDAALAARRATELKSDYAVAYLLWGQSLMQRRDWDQAISPLRKGVAIRPEMIDLQLALGEALLEAGQLKEAEIYLKNAEKLDAKNERVAAALRRIQQQK